MTYFLAFLSALGAVGTALGYKYWVLPYQDHAEEPLAQSPPAQPVATPVPAAPVAYPDARVQPPALLWDTPEHAWHSVRVLCDNAGLSLKKTILVDGMLYAPKDILCSCIFQESGFDNRAVHKNAHTTDYGICQFNDGKNPKTGVPYWIGPGALFSTSQDVYDNPERAVKTMIECYKEGNLKLWASYSTGANKQWLKAGSRMWLLAS